MADENEKITKLTAGFKSADALEFKLLAFSYLADPENETKAYALMDKVINSPSLQQDFKNKYQEPEPTATITTAADIKLIEPKDTQEGIQQIKDNMRLAKYIKAYGANFAFTDVKTSKEVQISMKGFTKVVDVDQTLLLQDEVLENPVYRNKAKNKLYLKEVGAGATIDRLTSELEKDNLALMNQPGFGSLSYLGVALVGGHGSGIDLKPLADYIVSMNVLVIENGEVVERRIEAKSNPITNIAEYEKQTGIKVLRDDDTLMNAFRFSVGALGVVLSYIIQVQDFFYLKEKRDFYTWDELKKDNTINELLRKKEVHSVHMWFNPYPYKKDGHHEANIWCLVSTYEFAQIGEPNTGRRGSAIDYKGVKKMGHFLLHVLEHMPFMLPFVLNYSLNLCKNEGSVLLPCHKALNFGTPNDADVDPTNCGIPYERLKEAADNLFEFLNENRNEHPVTSPIGFRFVAKTNGLLAAQYGQPTCMIELPLLSNLGEIKEKNSNTLLAFNELMMNHYKGKPHWGQHIHPDILMKRYRDIYGDNYDDFLAIYQKYGKKKFSNYFTEVLKLDED